MSGPANEREQINQAVGGSEAALERLLLDNYTQLTEWVRHSLRADAADLVDTDDIVQQTFAKVFQRIGSYEDREGGSFFAWLKTIAENQLRDAVRAQKRKKRGGDRQRIRDDADHERGVAGLLDVIVGDDETPSRAMGRREAIQAVHVALAELSEEHRMAVQLRFIEGRSIEETANTMGRTTSAIRGLLDRAKKRMRETMGRASMYLTTK